MLVGSPAAARAPDFVNTITSRHNPIVKRYRVVARGEARDLVLLDGAHLIEEAMRAHARFETVAWSPRGETMAGVSHAIDELRSSGVEIASVADPVMDAISPVQSASGIVALARRPAWTLEQALEASPQMIVAAVDVQDPGNAGAIVRSAEAGGATAALFCGASADPFGWKALRGSMGSVFRLPVVSVDAGRLLLALRASGIRVLAAVPRGGQPLFDVDLRGPAALLLGGEGPGLPDDLVAAADTKITIPMRGPVESLNVAVSAALVVYEASRQRRTFA